MGVPSDHGSAAMMATAGAIDMQRMILLPDNAGWLCHVFGISFQVMISQKFSTLTWIMPFFSYKRRAGLGFEARSSIRDTIHSISYSVSVTLTAIAGVTRKL
jgi:hypothetical protein